MIFHIKEVQGCSSQVTHVAGIMNFKVSNNKKSILGKNAKDQVFLWLGTLPMINSTPFYKEPNSTKLFGLFNVHINPSGQLGTLLNCFIFK